MRDVISINTSTGKVIQQLHEYIFTWIVFKILLLNLAAAKHFCHCLRRNTWPSVCPQSFTAASTFFVRSFQSSGQASGHLCHSTLIFCYSLTKTIAKSRGFNYAIRDVIHNETVTWIKYNDITFVHSRTPENKPEPPWH